MKNFNNFILENIESNDIIITIPKTILWSDYEKELKAVEDYKQVMNFKVANFPKTSIGNKCYLCYNGQIIGWMKIVGLSEKEFTCSTTGKTWKGKFIERSGPLKNCSDSNERISRFQIF